MFLKELQIAGFKSFAQAVKLELGPGVTAVIGPNGSGKSNIVDAVRWVLGEQSARALRGARGEDVIFSGSAMRHPLGMAEVTLVLDNSDGRVAVDLAEIAIARRLYRSGETEYLLNRKRARLRDVLDVAAQAGLGPDSYCVVGQGAIEQLVMQRSQERRSLIADAADIRRFEAQLAEIESDLSQTQGNALRMAAVAAEIRPQLDRLRVQAERAERHRRVREELGGVARAWFRRAIPGVEEQLVAADRRRLGLQADIAAARRAFEEGEWRRSALAQAGAGLREHLAGLRTELDLARTNREGLRVKRAALTERLEGLAQRRKGLAAESTAAGHRLATALQAVVRGRAALQAASADLEEPRQHEEADEQLRIAGARAAEAAGLLRELQRQLDRARLEMESLRRDEQQAHRRSEALASARAERDQAEATVRSLGEELARAQGEAKLTRRRETELEDLLRQARAEAVVLSRSAAEGEAALAAALRLVDGLEAEQRALANLGASAEAGRRPSDLVERLPTTPSDRRAVAAALGDAAHYQVVSLDDTAWSIDGDESDRRVLAPARRARMASATAFAAAVEAALGGGLGYRLGPDLLTPAADRDLADRYLGATIVVADLADARRAAALLAAAGIDGFQVATRSGHCLRGSGEHALRPGPDEARSIQLSERQAELGIALAAAQAGARAAEGTMQEARAAAEAAHSRLSELEAERREIGVTIARLEQGARGTRAEIQREQAFLARQLELPVELGSPDVRERRRFELAARIADVEERVTAHTAEVVAAEGARLLALQQHAAATPSREAALERLERLRDAVTRDEREAEQLSQREAALGEEVAAIGARIESLAAEQTALVTELGSVDDLVVDRENRIAEAASEMERKQAELETFVEAQQEAQAGLGDLRAAEATAGAEVEHARGVLDRLRVEAAGIAELLGQEASTLTDAAPGSPSELAAEDDERLQARLARAQRDLRNVGGVDYGMLAEYSVLRDRYAHISEQLEDLAQTEAKIRSGMDEVRERVRKQFTSAFEDVNARFQETFRDLFGGGDAELQLSGDPDGPDCGIDIIAQPPGKRLNRLATLSGGERALVGAALLLALIGSNPSPFCMLDEVDAALDDANVERFVGTIRDMARQTQFVLVTHNRATMEMADTLYGVTMTPGAVSQVLAIKLPG